MARKPGYLVEFQDKEGIKHMGRTFNGEVVNGKVVVYYLDAELKQVNETVTKDGKQVQEWKRRLYAADKLRVRGMCD